MTYQTADKYVRQAIKLGIQSHKATVRDSDKYMVIFIHGESHVSAVTPKEAKEFLGNFSRVGRFFG